MTQGVASYWPSEEGLLLGRPVQSCIGPSRKIPPRQVGTVLYQPAKEEYSLAGRYTLYRPAERYSSWADQDTLHRPAKKETSLEGQYRVQRPAKEETSSAGQHRMHR
ncbi:hypothetical protein PCANC_20955 [Puccinia coronata f. sp. avenae]|uniref:Uncharacterized protein n=1 Tax=Puccinia coronata f. sp. avenae TaxID=200324 RepID=A0A2N5TS73_9BASI|nr:hypothetical protein PCANC_20955 [Puccinia coronata f. sp. avenae]